MKPFSEVSLFDQGNTSDAFYATGSRQSIGETPGTFSTSLKNKQQIRVSFSVNSAQSMEPNSSSIYYFSPTNKNWSKPTGINFTGPFENVSMLVEENFGSYPRGPAPAGQGCLGSIFVEDHLTFDNVGSPIASGSLKIFRVNKLNSVSSIYSGSQKTQESSRGWNFYKSRTSPIKFNRSSISEIISKDYPDSFQRSSIFNAVNDQTFVLPVTEPFLIEKAVIEIPFCFGENWFNDKTTIFTMTSSLSDYPAYTGDGVGVGSSGGWFYWNDGGPRITVSLMSQKSYGTQKIRDLISSGIITHENDALENKQFSVTQIFKDLNVFSNVAHESYVVHPVGRTYRNNDYVIKNQNKFTGSVILKTEASISNGASFIKISAFGPPLTSIPGTSYEEFLNKNFNEEYSSQGSASVKGASNTGLTALQLKGINPFGRAMTGFSPSGGSIFGGEYSTIDAQEINDRDEYKNPFYISDKNARDNAYLQVSSSLFDGFDFSTKKMFILMGADFFLGNEKPSPYLVYPGEKLILSVSKHRPAIKNFKISIDPGNYSTGKANLLSSSYYSAISNGIGHDVYLNTGSINITFYGSYVRAGNSYIP